MILMHILPGRIGFGWSGLEVFVGCGPMSGCAVACTRREASKLIGSTAKAVRRAWIKVRRGRGRLHVGGGGESEDRGKRDVKSSSSYPFL